MQELPVMTVQLAVSLESMSHTERIIYYRVAGHDFHPKACKNTAVSHPSVFEIRHPMQPFVKLNKEKRALPFSASGARTSKIISFFSCSVCFWKRRTSSSAILVEANCSLLDSEKPEDYQKCAIKKPLPLQSSPLKIRHETLSWSFRDIFGAFYLG